MRRRLHNFVREQSVALARMTSLGGAEMVQYDKTLWENVYEPIFEETMEELSGTLFCMDTRYLSHHQKWFIGRLVGG
jgi:hypothetical protein